MTCADELSLSHATLPFTKTCTFAGHVVAPGVHFFLPSILIHKSLFVFCLTMLRTSMTSFLKFQNSHNHQFTAFSHSHTYIQEREKESEVFIRNFVKIERSSYCWHARHCGEHARYQSLGNTNGVVKSQPLYDNLIFGTGIKPSTSSPLTS